MLPPRALACIPGTVPGCTSWRGPPRPTAAAFPTWTGPFPIPPSKPGGLMVLSIALRPMSDWDSESCTVEVASALLAFRDSVSRGSSWQRWPIFRFMHLVQGLSYKRSRKNPLAIDPSRRRWGGGNTYKITCHVLRQPKQHSQPPEQVVKFVYLDRVGCSAGLRDMAVMVAHVRSIGNWHGRNGMLAAHVGRLTDRRQ